MNKLFLNDISEIIFSDINKYTLENEANIKEIDYWISFFHKSHEGFYYYVLNNGIVGIIYEDIEDTYNSIQLIFNEKEDEFYDKTKRRQRYNNQIFYW